MSFNFHRLLTSYYYLDPHPGGEFLLGYGLLLFFLAALFAGRIVRSKAQDDKYLKKSIRKKFGKFVFLGVVGLILVAARFSAVPFFSMRLWLYLVFVATLLLGVKTLFQIRNEYKKRLASVEREKEKHSNFS